MNADPILYVTPEKPILSKLTVSSVPPRLAPLLNSSDAYVTPYDAFADFPVVPLPLDENAVVKPIEAIIT